MLVSGGKKMSTHNLIVKFDFTQCMLFTLSLKKTGKIWSNLLPGGQKDSGNTMP